MPLVVKDRVLETSTTTGTGTLTLAGASTGYQTFSSAIGNGNTTYYAISLNVEWEVGIGTVGAGTLSRDTVLESSNAGSLVNFSAGEKQVFCTYPAEKSVDIDTAQTLTNKTISVDNNTVSGIAASSFVLSNSSGNIDGSASQKAIPSGEVVGTTDTQTLSNKTLSSPSVTGSITFGDSSTQSTAATGFGFKNRIINGAMMIDQRNAGASTATADDTYCFDRWYALTQTASINVSRQTNQENGTPYNIRLTQNQASAQRMGIAQIIEGVNCIDLRGSSVVLNLRIRSSNSQAIRYAILEWTGTENAVTSDVVNSWTSATYTTGNFFISTTTTVTAVGSITPSANTWTSLSTPLTGTIGSSTNNIIVFVWTEGTAAQNFTLDISNVQLEKGSTATSFDYRPYGTELALCQRYYATSYFPFASVGTATTSGIISRVVEATLSYPSVNVTFPITMRTDATVTIYNPSTGGTGTMRNTNASTNIATIAVYAGSQYVQFQVNGVSVAAASQLTTHYTANAEL